MLNRTIGRFQLVVEDEIGVRANFVAAGEQERACVQIERSAIGGAGIPTQPDKNFGKARCLL